MENIPKKTTGDQIHSGLKVALSLIPYAGSPLAVLFETVFSAPIDRRREVWFSSLESEIERLCKSVEELSPEALSKNEVFISVAMQATQIALRNHQSEKLEALRNAIINSALETSVDDNKVLIFTHIIDEITTLHRRFAHFPSNLLKSLDRGFAKSASSPPHIIEHKVFIEMTEPGAVGLVLRKVFTKKS